MNLPKITKTQKGFTLVELLVVVAIMAILATVAATIFSSTQSRARDGKRQADVSAIAKALEANKTSGSVTYPALSGTWFAGGNVPTEAAGYVPQYSIVSPSSGTPSTAAKPVAWASTSPNPTAIAGTAVATVASGIPVSTANFSAFQVCALLENGTAPNIFCIPNTQ